MEKEVDNAMEKVMHRIVQGLKFLKGLELSHHDNVTIRLPKRPSYGRNCKSLDPDP